MRNKKGFTLIELIIAVAVLGAVAMLMYTFFGQGFALYTEEVKSADQQTDMREVLSEITNKVRVTPSDQISYVNDILTIDDHVYAYDGDRIIRNTRELATGISAFDVSITGKLLEIVLENNDGEQIATSLYLSY